MGEAGLDLQMTSDPLIANLAHRRVVDSSVDGSVDPEDLLSAGGVYEQGRAVPRIHGPAFVRREVSRLTSDRPCMSPIAEATAQPSACKSVEILDVAIGSRSSAESCALVSRLWRSPLAPAAGSALSSTACWSPGVP